MDFPTIKYDSPVVNVKGLCDAFETQSPATILSEPNGNRWGAYQIVVGVGGAYRIVIDVYGGESDVLEFVMGTDLGKNRLNQVAVAVGFWGE